MNQPLLTSPGSTERTSLSRPQLEKSLHAIQALEEGQSPTTDQLRESQLQRMELEVQNRSLREMQAELAMSVQRYADLYDYLPVGYVTVTAEGRILQANLAVAECLRVERQGLVGCHLRRFLDAYDAGRLAAHLENCAGTGRAATIELTLRVPEGAPLMVQFSSRLAPPGSDQTPQIHVAITDISKWKKAQRMLEDINHEQEAFNYSISHDLRAPLVTIGNYAGIVLSDHAAALNEEGRRMVQRIQNAASRMEATLKNLLRYSTLAREEIVLGPVDLNAVVSDLLIEHRGVIDERKAEIAIERPLPSVRGSAIILNQVLANLLTNALKYTEPEAAPRIRFFAEKQESQVILKVADHGIGIEPRYHERVFQIFERLHGYSRYPGSGVGLAIARRAVERMNGRIWVESEAGKGACFCLELPGALMSASSA